MIRTTGKLLAKFGLLSFFIVVLGISFLLFHPRGFSVAIWLFNATSNTHIHVSEVSGRLGDTFSLTDVKLDAPASSITAEKVLIRWYPHRLLWGKLSFERIEALNLSYVDHSTESGMAGAHVSSRLPLWFEVAHLSAADLRYQKADDIYRIDTLALEGRVVDDLWLVDRFSLSSPFGHLWGSAIVQADYSIGVTFEGQNLNPLANHPGWESNLSFKGHYYQTESAQQFQLDGIAGSWMGKQVSGRWVSYLEKNLWDWSGEIDINENHFSTQGHSGATPDIQWTIYAPNLGSLLPNAQGHFYSEGLLSPKLYQGSWDIEQFHWGQFSLSAMEGTLNGSAADHHLTLTGKVNTLPLGLRYTGHNLDGELEGIFEQLHIGEYQLDSPAKLLLSPSGQSLSHSCLSSADAYLCLDYEHFSHQWVVNIAGENFPLEALNPFMPAAFSIKGKSDFAIGYERSAQESIEGNTNIRVHSGAFEWIDEQGRRYDFPIQSVNMSLKGTEQVEGRLKLNLSEENIVDGRFMLDLLTDQGLWSAPILGVVTIVATDLDAIEFIAPSVDVIQGQVMANFEISGTLDRPLLTEGHALLSNISIPLLESNTKIEIEALRLVGMRDRILDLYGNGYMGEGSFDIKGVLDFEKAIPRAKIHINGENLHLLDTPSFNIKASPNIDYTLSASQAMLTGDLKIDSADIRIKDKQKNRSLSDDVVIISESELPSRKGLPPLQTHLRIKIPSPIKFQGFGLNARFTGDLRVDADENLPMTADGRLSLTEGEYRAFGKIFSVKVGELLYNGGPIQNPIVDIRAERTVERRIAPPPMIDSQQPPSHPENEPENVLVGLALNGPLKQPHLSFYSEPSMNDGDIISYLFIGRPQDQASAAQAEVLFQALSELIPSRTDKDLGSAFGLDEFGLTRLSDDPNASGSFLENAAFVVGKQLSDRLYIRYAHGLSSSIEAITSDLQLRLLLGRHFTLEGNADSNGYGGDLIFSIDIP